MRTRQCDATGAGVVGKRRPTDFPQTVYFFCSNRLSVLAVARGCLPVSCRPEENVTTEKLREEEAEEAAEGLKSADLKVAVFPLYSVYGLRPPQFVSSAAVVVAVTH